MKNLFFYKLYLFDKRLFYSLVLFSGLTILCNIKGDEITPFFIWAMYSEKEDPGNRYEVFRIMVNDHTPVDYTAGYTDNNSYFLSVPLSYHKKIEQYGHAEPTVAFLQKKLGKNFALIQPLTDKIHNGNLHSKPFVDWYARYLQQSTGKHISSYQVEVLKVHFLENQQVQIDSSYSLIQWRQP